MELFFKLCCCAWFGTLSSCTNINTYGLANTPNLPKFLSGGGTPLINGTPWGNADPAGPPPDTGMVRKYEFVIARANGAPDGYNRSLMLINNQYPGPLIEANWGDTIQVTVINNITGPEEGTTIHWHGQPMALTPWMDGVPSVTQCPIPPGSSFTYSYRAELWGTSWYHSHYSGQRIDGVQGPMAIYGPTAASYDIDIGPVILNDYTHVPYFQYVADVFDKPPTFLPLANNLINGRNPYNCSSTNSTATCVNNTTQSTFRFTSGKTHRLRLMNVGSADNIKFSIDGHQMTVIANDYVQIQPYNTTVVTLAVGQRTDVVVYGSGGPTGSAWMRSDLDTNQFCGNITTDQPNALATVYYEQADTTTLPNTQAYSWRSDNCTNDPLSMTVPVLKRTPPDRPAITQVFNVTAATNATGYLLFYINNQTFRGDYNDPVLSLANEGNTTYSDDPLWNVFDFHSNSTVRAIFYNYFPGPHPFHLHGHNFWVLATGRGMWDGTVVNPTNPQRRDTQTVGPGTPDNPAYTVIEWTQDNPGVWALHCHVLLHVSTGLYLNSMERPSDIMKYQFPTSINETCRAWNSWTSNHNVNQIDAGT